MTNGFLCAATLSLILLGPPTTAQEAPASQVGSQGMQAPGAILFVGNSYLYYGGGVHDHVARMARAAYPDASFTHRSETISGAYLAQHDIDTHLAQGPFGAAGPYDVVILQGHSTAQTTDRKRASFARTARAMDAMIRHTGARTALYMTPAYTEAHIAHDPDMLTLIDHGYSSVGNAIGAIVIPVGLAFAEAYARRPDIVLHDPRDGSHPALLGTYLAAATTFAALYEASVLDSPYTYFGAVGDDDARFLQQVAEDTVTAYYTRSDAGDTDLATSD